VDGKSLRNQLRLTLRELSNSEFLDEKSSYDFLYEAALELARLTQSLTAQQTITTVANQSSYVLNPDFYTLRLVNERNEWVVKYDDGSDESFIPYRSYEALLYSNITDPSSRPASISTADYQTVASNLTGTATTTGSASEAEPLLTTTTDVSAAAVGDQIHNTTDGSDGVVIEASTSHILLTNLFYGTNNFWTSGDAFVLVPQGRRVLVVNPPSLTSGHTITVDYIQTPFPVYSDFRSYRFAPAFAPALVKYAAWLYKYRDGEPDFGDKWFKFFAEQAKGRVHDTNKSLDRSRFRVNMIKRSLYDRSWR
jgi:hypothetical protein